MVSSLPLTLLRCFSLLIYLFSDNATWRIMKPSVSSHQPCSDIPIIMLKVSQSLSHSTHHVWMLIWSSLGISTFCSCSKHSRLWLIGPVRKVWSVVTNCYICSIGSDGGNMRRQRERSDKWGHEDEWEKLGRDGKRRERKWSCLEVSWCIFWTMFYELWNTHIKTNMGTQVQNNRVPVPLAIIPSSINSNRSTMVAYTHTNVKLGWKSNIAIQMISAYLWPDIYQCFFLYIHNISRSIPCEKWDMTNPR